MIISNILKQVLIKLGGLSSGSYKFYLKTEAKYPKINTSYSLHIKFIGRLCSYKTDINKRKASESLLF